MVYVFLELSGLYLCVFPFFAVFCYMFKHTCATLSVSCEFSVFPLPVLRSFMFLIPELIKFWLAFSCPSLLALLHDALHIWADAKCHNESPQL